MDDSSEMHCRYSAVDSPCRSCATEADAQQLSATEQIPYINFHLQNNLTNDKYAIIL